MLCITVTGLVLTLLGDPPRLGGLEAFAVMFGPRTRVGNAVSERQFCVGVRSSRRRRGKWKQPGGQQAIR